MEFSRRDVSRGIHRLPAHHLSDLFWVGRQPPTLTPPLKTGTYGTSRRRLSDKATPTAGVAGRGIILCVALHMSESGPTRKPPWPPTGSAVCGRPAAGALALIRRS